MYMKIFTWIILSLLLTLSFIKSINISNGQLMVGLMLLLLSLFSDLKEFDFWGLSGKKMEEKIQKIEDKEAFTPSDVDVNQDELNDAEKTQPQLMDTTQGNFLTLAFEIERLLRIFASISLGRDIQNTISIQSLTKELSKADLLTESGVQQLDAIRWLRNLIVHGRKNEINDDTLNSGLQIATNLYNELHGRLYAPQQSSQKE